eukprot:2047160-Pleurochrysis_carterae.AAC.4
MLAPGGRALSFGPDAALAHDVDGDRDGTTPTLHQKGDHPHAVLTKSQDGAVQCASNTADGGGNAHQLEMAAARCKTLPQHDTASNNPQRRDKTRQWPNMHSSSEASGKVELASFLTSEPSHHLLT